jgi:hypothetical protein
MEPEEAGPKCRLTVEVLVMGLGQPVDLPWSKSTSFSPA